jgi:hypothetical protein
MLHGEVAPSEASILQTDLTNFNVSTHAAAAHLSCHTPLLTRKFQTHSRQISAQVSSYLQHSASTIAVMAGSIDPDPQAAASPYAISQLPSNVGGLLEGLAAQAAQVTTSRARIADLMDQIHAAHRDLLELAVRILEQTTHGSVVRGVRARAEQLAAVAKGLDFKIRWVWLFAFFCCLEKKNPLF